LGKKLNFFFFFKIGKGGPFKKAKKKKKKNFLVRPGTHGVGFKIALDPGGSIKDLLRYVLTHIRKKKFLKNFSKIPKNMIFFLQKFFQKIFFGQKFSKKFQKKKIFLKMSKKSFSYFDQNVSKCAPKRPLSFPHH